MKAPTIWDATWDIGIEGVRTPVLLIIIAIFATIFVALLSIRFKFKKSGAASKDLLFEKYSNKSEKLLVVVIYLSGITLGGFAAAYSSHWPEGWGFVLAFLPYVLIVQHAMFLRIVRQPALTPLEVKPGAQVNPSEGHPPKDEDGDEHWWRFVLESAKEATERYFSPVSLAIRYGTSAVAVLLVGLVAFLMLFADHSSAIPPSALRAAQMGAAGAYVYVLAYLGPSLTRVLTAEARDP